MKEGGEGEYHRGEDACEGEMGGRDGREGTRGGRTGGEEGCERREARKEGGG